MRFDYCRRYWNQDRRRATLDRSLVLEWAALPYDTDCSFRKDSFGGLRILTVRSYVSDHGEVHSTERRKHPSSKSQPCRSMRHPLYCKSKFWKVNSRSHEKNFGSNNCCPAGFVVRRTGRGIRAKRGTLDSRGTGRRSRPTDPKIAAIQR